MFDEFGDPIDTGSGFPVEDPTDSSGFLGMGNIGGLMPAGLFSSPGRTAIAGAAGAVGRALGRGYGAIIVAGRQVPVKKVWEIAKKFGPEVAAAAVGYGVAD